MGEGTNSALSETEAEIYDRQIRLWGIQAQAKLRSTKALIIGMDGLGAEIFKNISLAGVKAITLLDQRLVTAEDLKSQFFIDKSHIGQPIAEASMTKAQELNPLVSVNYEKQPFSELPSDYMKQFDIIISCNQVLPVNLKLDDVCRQNELKFYACSVFGTFGFVFSDLFVHKYIFERLVVSQNGDIKVPEKMEVGFPSLKETLDADLSDSEFLKTMRKKPISVFIFKVLMKFHELYGRDPGSNEEDFLNLTKLRDAVLEGVPAFKDRIPDELLRCISTSKPNTICALVGAVAAQEIIKAVSGKDAPLRNFFFFDPITLSGHYQYIGPVMSEPKIIT